MLDRIGNELARATSVVRYAAGSHFSRHMHDQGEEFLVLSGTFSDEHGHYPCGTYVRNPPGTGHSPYSEAGCEILVKLRQFDAHDLAPIVVDTRRTELWCVDDKILGHYLPLHHFQSERVAMRKIAGGQTVSENVQAGGLEWFLVSGALILNGERIAAHSWMRFPVGDKVSVTTDVACEIWQKTGHLQP